MLQQITAVPWCMQGCRRDLQRSITNQIPKALDELCSVVIHGSDNRYCSLGWQCYPTYLREGEGDPSGRPIHSLRLPAGIGQSTKEGKSTCMNTQK